METQSIKQVQQRQQPDQVSSEQPPKKRINITAQKLLPFIFSIRFILSIFLLRNYDQPDQSWQGPEIAHYLVFGYGYRTWEWTMEKPIRNHAWPLFISLSYRIVSYLGLDDTILIVYAPKLLQILVASTFDYFLIKINTIYNPGTTWKLLVINYTSWFSLTIISRSYIQSFEATLTLIAFYAWNLRKIYWKMDYLSRSIVVMSFVVRSTCIMFWAVIWPYELFTMKGTLKDRALFILKNIITVFMMVGGAIVFQFLWRGQFTFIQYNFFHYNVVLKWSQFYGAEPTFSFFYIFLPFVLGGSLPFFYFGVRKILNKKRFKPGISRAKEILIQIVLIMALLSTSSHKQPRFLTICLPLFLMICVKGYSKMTKFLFIFSLSVNLFIFSIYNVCGRDGVVKVLQDIRIDNSVESIMFITSCHYTPMYSNFHRNVFIRFPDCSPLNRAKAVDQNAIYHWNATQAYNIMLKDFKNPPSHLVVQGDAIKRFHIPRNQYELISDYKNSGFLEDIFIKSNSVSLWRRKDIKDQNNRKDIIKN